MSSEMVERVAEVLAGHFGAEFHELAIDKRQLRARVRLGEASINDATREDVLIAAKAAIEEMREPTPKMLDAAGGECVNLERADDPSYEPRDVWSAMITAALGGE